MAIERMFVYMDAIEAMSKALALGYRLEDEGRMNLVWYGPDGTMLAEFADYIGARGWIGDRLSRGDSSDAPREPFGSC